MIFSEANDTFLLIDNKQCLMKETLTTIAVAFEYRLGTPFIRNEPSLMKQATWW